MRCEYLIIGEFDNGYGPGVVGFGADAAAAAAGTAAAAAATTSSAGQQKQRVIDAR